MDMTLTQWNELVEYGATLCNALIDKGHQVKLKPYTMHDGRKGLAMQVFDNLGNFFTEYYTGIYPYATMRKNLQTIAKRILEEC